MKKFVAFLTALTLLGSLTACERNKTEVIPDPSPSVSVFPTPTPTPTPSPTPEPTEAPTAEDIFPRSFAFGSGSGGWGTELDVAEDGSFSGYYQDMDMGGDPPTTHFCRFTGQFSKPEKVDEYTYSVKLDELKKENAEEWTDKDGMHWVPGIAYGLEDQEEGDEFLIYLPGAPIKNLPEYFVQWSAHGYDSWDYDSWDNSALPGYGLYNVKELLGWYEYERETILPRAFCFMNGVGGWHSELYIEEDGSFAGHMEDWLGWGAEEGDMLWCGFSGKLSQPKKVNDYTYSVQLEELAKGSDGAEETEADVVVVDDARGLECGEEFLIFLPGAPLDELPEEFVGWVRSPGGIEENDTVLPWYGLYNVNEQCGWFEW